MSKPVRRSGEKVWKPLTLCTWSSKMKERGEQRGNIWEINDKELFRFDKDMSLHIQKAQYSLNMLIRNNLILMHCSKMAERQNQENLFTANRKENIANIETNVDSKCLCSSRSWKVLEKCLQISCMLSHSVVADSVTLWAIARQVPLSMGFSRQE